MESICQVVFFNSIDKVIQFMTIAPTRDQAPRWVKMGSPIPWLSLQSWLSLCARDSSHLNWGESSAHRDTLDPFSSPKERWSTASNTRAYRTMFHVFTMVISMNFSNHVCMKANVREQTEKPPNKFVNICANRFLGETC